MLSIGLVREWDRHRCSDSIHSRNAGTSSKPRLRILLQKSGYLLKLKNTRIISLNYDILPQTVERQRAKQNNGPLSRIYKVRLRSGSRVIDECSCNLMRER